MPFAAQTQLDDPNDPRKNAQGGVNISGQSTSVSTNLPGQDVAAGEKSKSSGQYTNIQTYLDANKQQGDAMGSKISDTVGAKAEDATQKIQSLESKAPTVEAYDPNEALGRVTALNDAEKTKYKQTKATGGYSGPQDISGVEGYAETNKLGNEVAGLVKNVGNEAGQRELLKNTYARPDYSAGQNNLDQALVQGSAGSKSKLEALGQKYSGLSSALSAANEKVGSSINAANTQALKNKQAFAAAEQSARDALINPLQQRAILANQNNGALIDRIVGDASDETLSDETLNALGLTSGQRLYDLDLKNYVNQDRSQVGIDNVADANERQKYLALASLFEDPTMNQVTANGKTITPVSFNKEKFDKDYAGKQAEFDRNSKAANFTGYGSGSFDGESFNYSANGNAANYLTNPGDISVAGTYTSLPGGVSASDEWRSEYQAARQGAINNLYAQINQFLDSQKYNRTIKKG